MRDFLPNSCLSLHPSSASTVSTPDRTDTGEAAVLSAALGDLRRSCCNPIQAHEPRQRLRLGAGTICVAMNSRCSKCVKVKDVVGRDKDGGEFRLTCATVDVVIIGNSGVGKTSPHGQVRTINWAFIPSLALMPITIQYFSGHFSTGFRLAIGTDFYHQDTPSESPLQATSRQLSKSRSVPASPPSLLSPPPCSQDK